MRNFPSAFSYFLIFHEFNEAEKQERQRRLRKLAMELLSTLKEKYGQEKESISSKSLFSSSNSSIRADSVA
jgi:S-methylmethionine-dependent homocysteine/selenocysteine methylase